MGGVCLVLVGLLGLNGAIRLCAAFAGTVNGPSAADTPMSVVGTLGIVLGAWYLLTMLRRVFFGPVKEPAHEGHNGPVHDLNLREIMAILPIATLFVVLGVYPQPVLDTSRPDLRVVARIANEAKNPGASSQQDVTKAPGEKPQ